MRQVSKHSGGFVYFAQEGGDGPVKVGWAIDPRARVPVLAAGNPEPLRLIGAIAGSPAAERAVHSRFSASRIRGEWFAPTPELVALARQSAPPPWWPSEEAPLMQLLSETGERWREAANELDRLARERDALIVEASRDGASRREVAAAAAVTAGRVQQIVARAGQT